MSSLLATPLCQRSSVIEMNEGALFFHTMLGQSEHSLINLTAEVDMNMVNSFKGVLDVLVPKANSN